MASTAGLPEPPDKVTLEKLSKTMTDDQIADRYGRTRSAISYWRNRYGIDRDLPARMNHKDFIPWTVSVEHARHYVPRMLRLWSVREQGGGLSPAEAAQLEKFEEYIASRKVVVDYDPDRGWGWRNRLPRERGPVRRPEHVKV